MDTLFQEYSESVFSEENHVLGYKTSYSFPCEGQSLEEEKVRSDASLKFISEMLMEDFGNEPCMFYDSSTLQAIEKSLNDALNNDLDKNPGKRKTKNLNVLTKEQRTKKQYLANNMSKIEPVETYGNVLLDEGMMQTKAKKKGSNKGDVVDLQSLLIQCVKAMANIDRMTIIDLLLRIRSHSSPHGDGNERLAHYFVNALEARLAGTGSALYTELSLDRISTADICKAYKTYVTAIPLNKMSHLLANKTIEELASGAATLHILDFGILYGHQWHCLIQALSERRGGPPKLRITGIDLPQTGAETVTNTGLRLAKYCEMFGVPFEYNAITQKWDTIRAEDLKIHKNECLVVNSLYRLHNMLDEEIELVVSPRNVVLNLIKSINPDMFIHGVINGTYNSPFFINRFREALFHYGSMFDMFEAAMPREDRDRLLFEEQNFGKYTMNIIACEGAERIERPDTYKMWDLRSVKAGFRHLPFDPKVVSYVRRKVKRNYHKDFSVEEDGQWVLHGWKGRVNRAISCWQPAHN